MACVDELYRCPSWTTKFCIDFAANFVFGFGLHAPGLHGLLSNRIKPLALLVYLTSLRALHPVETRLWYNIECLGRSQVMWLHSDLFATIMDALCIECLRGRILVAILLLTFSTSSEQTEYWLLALVCCEVFATWA